MQQSKKIRVLIVDDSLVFREVLSRGLSGDPRIEVVAKASTAFEARDKILETSPDIITCDMEADFAVIEAKFSDGQPVREGCPGGGTWLGACLAGNSSPP